MVLNVLNPFYVAAIYAGSASSSLVSAEEATPSASQESDPLPSTSPEPTTVPSPDPTPTPSPEPEVTTTLPNPSNEEITDQLPEPDLEPTQEESSAQLVSSVTTDKADYGPDEAVLITGSELEPNTTYLLRVSSSDPPPSVFETQVNSDDTGTFVYSYQLDGHYRPDYLVEIYLSDSLVTSVTFTDAAPVTVPKASIDIDQCENGSVSGLPGSDTPCVAGQWVNGNVNQSKAHYYEGDSVPYRAKIGDVTSGITYTLELEWDTTKGGKHALDYITSFDRTETDADPCSDVLTAGICSSPASGPIPTDPGAVNQIAGNFTLYNGTFVSVGPTYALDGLYTGDSSTSIELIFTADSDGDAVLAWGGHIATRADWGEDNSAIDIPGSPYHMRLKDFDCSDPSNCSAGNQDLSLSAGAVIFPASITIVKQADPEGSTSFDFSGGLGNFSLTDDGTLANTTTFADITDFTTYDITELVPSGWSLDSVSCDDGSPVDLGAASASVTVDEGDSVTCTFTNSLNAGTLTVIKNVDSDNDGQVDIFGDTTWTWDIASGEQNISTGSQRELLAGAYTISEDQKSGYHVVGWDCNDQTSGNQESLDINLATGENLICTVTNARDTGIIRVEKQTNPDSDPTNFTFSGDVAGTASDGQFITVANIPTGQYTSSEATSSGWVLESISCDDGDSSGNLDTRTATFNLDVDETVTCTFTNNKTPLLTVIKELLPSNDPGLFDLTIDGNTIVTDVGDGGTTGAQESTIGPHTVGEIAGTSTSLTDYNITYSDNCSDGTVNLNYGDDVTCTITNTRKVGEITFIKDVLGGDAIATDWEFDVLSVGTFQNGTYIFNTGVYTVTETSSVLGYTATGVSGICSDLTNINGSTASATLTVTEDGGTCTFENTRDTGSVTVNKLVDTNGDGSYDSGNDTANSLGFAWILDAGGFRDMGTTAASVETTVGNTTHSISETIATDYSFVGWYAGDGSCSSPDGVSVPFNINVTKDTETVLTLCNVRDTGSITVYKNLDTDGDGQVDIFGDTNWTYDIGGAGNYVMGSTQTRVTGDYQVSEDMQSLYHVNNLTCDGEDYGATESGQVAISDNHETICTFTNTINPGSITIIKNAISNNPQDFTFNNDFGNNNPASFLLDDDGNINNTLSNTRTFEVLPGTYSASEDPTAGWKLSDVTCDDASPIDSIQVSPNETVTCTFTNKQLGSIVLIKNTIGGNGVFDFTMTGDTLPASAKLTTVAGTDTETFTLIDPENIYSITEVDPTPEWDLTNVSCLNENQVVKDPTNFSINTGGTVTCTFQNTARGQIIVEKVVDPSQSSETFQFTTSYNNGFFLGHGQSDTSALLVPGNYSATELGKEGWDITSATCDDGSDPSDIGLDPGETVTCTFQNTQRGQITIIKNTVGSDGLFKFSSQELGKFDITTTSNTGSEGFLNLLPGTYSVEEFNPEPGWDITSATCDDNSDPSSINLDPGEHVTCTFENTQRGNIIVVKNTIGGDGIFYFTSQTLGDFNITTSTNTGSEDFLNLTPGSYDIAEVDPAPSWDLTSFTCDDGSDLSNINLDPGETVTCTLENTQRGSITVYKQTNPEESNQLFTFNLGGDATDSADISSGSHSHFTNLIPGNYSLTEIIPTGWYFEYANCADQEYLGGDNISLTAGQDISCTFYNTQFGNVTVTKYNDSNGNGQKDEEEQVMSDWDIHLLDSQDSTSSAATDQSGQAYFNNIKPGIYNLSETIQDGWQQTNITCDQEGQTDIVEPENIIGKLINLIIPIAHATTVQIVPNNNYPLFVPAGSDIHCQIGNRQDPVLTIAKSNSANSDLAPGSTVSYTVKVLLTGSNLSDVHVYDLPPEGFEYVNGSWTALSSERGDLKAQSITGEPTYSSPGTWELGDMIDGELITLTYIALINTDQDPGDYKDLALAYGCLTPTDDCLITDGNVLLALATDSQYIEGNFAGTNVVVSADNRETGGVELEGEVLGASTYLPATGANSNWLILAALLFASGLLSLLYGFGLKKGVIRMLAVIITFTALMASPNATLAYDDPGLSIRIEDPSSPTRVDNFDLSFTVLDLFDRSSTAKCFYKDPSDAGFSQLGLDVPISAGGNSDTCAVDSSILSEQGEYEFYVTVDAGSGAESSAITKVTYDATGPGTPNSYSKDHPSFCRWVIKFHTSNEGDTTRVEIYSSDQKGFSTDGGTRVGDVTIGPDEDGEFIHDRANDCDKEYYYVLRAFDAAGNQSAHIGDSIIATETTETVTAADAIPSGTTQGTVLGDDTDATEADEDGEGDVLGTEGALGNQEGLLSTDQDDDSSIFPYWLIGIILAYLAYYFYQGYRSEQ